MRHLIKLSCLSVALAAHSALAATGTLTPLTSFSGDGLLAPGENVYVTTDNLQRGLAYNPSTGHVLLVSRTNPTGTNGNNIRILDGTTGADLGGLDSTGISGGTFGVNQVGVTSAGVIYVANLQAATSATANFTVYRYANETSTNTQAYNGSPVNGVRIGDAFDVTGSGVNTRFVGGYNATNGYAAFTTTDGLTFTASNVTVTGTAAGDFRLGDTFGTSSSNVLGRGNSAGIRNSTFSGTTGTLNNTIPVTGLATGGLQSTAENLIDYGIVGTTPILLTQSTGDGRVRVYDATDLSNPLILATSTALAGLTANGNSSGQITLGAITGNTATIYALSTNTGIQAFTLTIAVPEPTTLAAVAGVGMLALVRRRRA